MAKSDRKNLNVREKSTLINNIRFNYIRLIYISLLCQ
jgi:hypothetical protein